MASDGKGESVKDILIEMKSLAEICLNLAFASIMYNDKNLAEQILVIEGRIDTLYRNLLEHLSLSIKTRAQAKQLRIYFIIGEASNIISDSAADIASIVLRELDFDDEIKAVQTELEELTDLVLLDSKSPLCGKTEVTSDVHNVLGIDIVGLIKKDTGFTFDYKEIMEQGDSIIFRGPVENANVFMDLARGKIPTIEEARERIINSETVEKKELKPHQQVLIQIKETADLLVDLAYLYALEDLPKIRSLVLLTEDQIDNLQYELISMVLNLYKEDKMTKNTLMGYLQMADSFEEIADAAIKIAFGVTIKHKHYEILERVVEDSSESIDYIIVTKDSPHIGQTIKKAEVTDDFFQVIAIRKKGKFILYPEEDVIITRGDGLIIREYSNPEQD